MKKLITLGSFEQGGWTFDTDFIPVMGMPYLMAHGIGRPVADASASFTLSEGTYHMYVYTFNWVAPWKKEYAPGLFEIAIDGTNAGTYGNAPESWGFVQGADITLYGSIHTVTLHDLTGFDGRIGCILLTDEDDVTLPSASGYFDFFQELTGNPSARRLDADFVVAGGGFSGMCAAVMAARRGTKTILIQDRPVVGGNNSSEARVWLGGSRNAEPMPGVGNIVGEFEQEKVGHYGPENCGAIYEDERKEAVIREAGVELLLNCTVKDVIMKNGAIDSLVVWNTRTDEVFTVKAPVYADCTGDGTLGFMAGADFEVTTNGHMGKSNVWYVQDTGVHTEFPECPWAIDLKGIDIPGREGVPDIYGGLREKSLGGWFWESGMEQDPIKMGEYARDLNLRAMYGAWDALKNHDHDYDTWEIGESMVIGGMRESRRLFGDVLLTKSEVYQGIQYPDGCVPSFWNFDVHYPDPRFYRAFHEGDAFLTHDYHERFNKPFWVPYRCLYSRNIPNLFMAGRNVSVSHDALGTVRVMRTCGMMGEVVGLAASICTKYHTRPRSVYAVHLDEFMDELKKIPYNGIPRPIHNSGL